MSLQGQKKKSQPRTGQATGWSLTYNKALTAPGPRAFSLRCPPLSPLLWEGPSPWQKALAYAKEAGRRTGPCCSSPPPPSQSGGQPSVRARPKGLPRGPEARPTPGAPRDRRRPRCSPGRGGPGALCAPTHQGGRGGELGAGEHLRGRRPGAGREAQSGISAERGRGG